MDSQLVRPVGFSKVVAELALRNPPPLLPELLDGLHEADRAPGDRLGDTVQGVVDADRPGQRLHGALADEDEPGEERDREHDVEQATGHVDPEVPDGRGVAPGEAPHQAMATAMPMTGLRNCSSVSAPIWEKYDIVVSPP